MSCETNQRHFDFLAIFEGGGILSRDFEIAEESGTTLSDAEMEFRLAGSETVALSLTVGDGLTLTSMAAGAWVITMEQIAPTTLTPGLYSYNLKTTDADGMPQFYVGGTLTILNR